MLTIRGLWPMKAAFPFKSFSFLFFRRSAKYIFCGYQLQMMLCPKMLQLDLCISAKGTVATLLSQIIWGLGISEIICALEVCDLWCACALIIDIQPLNGIEYFPFLSSACATDMVLLRCKSCKVAWSWFKSMQSIWQRSTITFDTAAQFFFLLVDLQMLQVWNPEY